MKMQVGEITIEYELEGPEDAPVLMLHHSLATSRAMWDVVNMAMTPYYRVLRYDARGHGGSDAPPGSYDFAQLAEDAAGLMDGLGIGRAIHVGISMGGMVSQVLAISAPHRVEGLVLVSTTSKMPLQAEPIWDQRIAAVNAHGMAPQVDETIKRWFTKDFRDTGDDVLVEIGEQIRRTPVNGYCGWGAAIRDLDLTTGLGRIRIPTLVLVGENDPGTPPAMSQVIADNIPGAKLKIFEDASHMLPLQQPDDFLESLIDFVEDLDDEE